MNEKIQLVHIYIPLHIHKLRYISCGKIILIGNNQRHTRVKYI